MKLSEILRENILWLRKEGKEDTAQEQSYWAGYAEWLEDRLEGEGLYSDRDKKEAKDKAFLWTSA